MPSDLILIGKSGAAAARSALEMTAQNIANAGNTTYARRSLSLSEVAATGGIGTSDSAALSGVRVDAVLRTQALFLQTEVRRTSSDINRAEAELQGLRNAESAVEQAGIYPAIVEFEASLSQLVSDPLDGALRADALEAARTLTQTFAIATEGLSVAAEELRFDAAAGVDEVNTISSELARTNVGLARAQNGSVNKAALLDQRDALLVKLSSLTGIATQFDTVGRVTVSLGGSGGPTLVSGNERSLLAVAVNSDDTLSFSINGNPVALGSGSLVGQAQGLEQIGQIGTKLDALAQLVITRANTAQAGGVTPAGTPGQPLFAGTGAGDISLAMADGSGFATAPAGAGANSRNTANLEAFRAAMANDGPAQASDRLLFELSSTISGRTITRDALRTIAETAEIALTAETGVDLDAEAANLLRFQQAFQASGRVIQVAADVFDTMLGIS
jgi:flagellar hook-associated protein 1 FlgK